MVVAGRVGATVVSGELAEGPGELRSPVVLCVAVVLGVAVVGLASVEGEPEGQRCCHCWVGVWP